jgi:hypothetical protein
MIQYYSLIPFKKIKKCDCQPCNNTIDYFFVNSNDHDYSSYTYKKRQFQKFFLCSAHLEDFICSFSARNNYCLVTLRFFVKKYKNFLNSISKEEQLFIKEKIKFNGTVSYSK